MTKENDMKIDDEKPVKKHRAFRPGEGLIVQNGEKGQKEPHCCRGQSVIWLAT